MRTPQTGKVGRRALFVATLLALAVGPTSVAAAGVDPVGPTPAPSPTWIVILTDHGDAEREAHALVQPEGGRVLAVYSHVLDGFEFSGSPAAAAALARNPRVAHVEATRSLHAVEIAPNGILRTSAWAAHQA